MNSTFLRIQNYLRLNASFNNNIGLLGGKAAYPLFLLQDFASGVKGVNPNELDCQLENILCQVNFQTPVNFSDGIAGVGILLEYLSAQGYLEQDTNELLEEAEPYLLRAIYAGKCQDISIANGISGMGLYLLHRVDAKTPASTFQQLRLKECIIACVDQIIYRFQEQFVNERPISKLDLSIWDGLPGVCLFLSRVQEKRYYEPATTQFLKKIATHVFNLLKDAPFSWEGTDAYFTLLHIALIKHDDVFTERVLELFSTYINQASSKKSSIRFHEAAFNALWLKLIAQEHSIDIAGFLASDINRYVTNTLDKVCLSEIFPYSLQEQSVPVGLRQGVCGTALPLGSLETGDYSWLSVLGIDYQSYISSPISNSKLVNS